MEVWRYEGMRVWRYGEIFRHDGMRACGTENKITFPRFPAFRTRELSFFEIQSIILFLLLCILCSMQYAMRDKRRFSSVGRASHS